jgi:hypothetical protein
MRCTVKISSLSDCYPQFRAKAPDLEVGVTEPFSGWALAQNATSLELQLMEISTPSENSIPEFCRWTLVLVLESSCKVFDAVKARRKRHFHHRQ